MSAKVKNSRLALWACSAMCKDGAEREVAGLYHGDKLVLVSRPWISPASVTALVAALGNLYPTLAALISVADFHLHNGVWYGQISKDWHALSAIVGGGARNTLGTHLTRLTRLGYIDYDVAKSKYASTRVRIFPHCAKTGLRVLRVEESWLHGFVLEVAPRAMVLGFAISETMTDLDLVAEPGSMTIMDHVVSSAPIEVVKGHSSQFWDGEIERADGGKKSKIHPPKSVKGEVAVDPSRSWDGVNEVSDYAVSAIRFRNVAGLDAVYRSHFGIDPRVGREPLSTLHGFGMVKEKANLTVSSGGVEMRFVDAIADAVGLGEVGSAHSWDVQADPIPVASEFEPAEDAVLEPGSGAEKWVEIGPESTLVAEKIPSVPAPFSPSQSREGCQISGPNPDPFAPSVAAGSGDPKIAEHQKAENGEHSVRYSFRHPSPSWDGEDVPMANGAKSRADLPGAQARPEPATATPPTAPPVSAPPSASSSFASKAPTRELRQDQVDALRAARGEILSVAEIKRKTSREISCIQFYTGVSGVPFCAKDVAWLNSCLNFTSHTLVLRAIRRCSEFPESNPGEYIFRDGMQHVYNLIKSNKFYQAKAVKGKRKTEKAGSSRSDAVNESIRLRREARAGTVSSPAPIVPGSASIVSPAAVVVSQEVEVVSPEAAEVEG